MMEDDVALEEELLKIEDTREINPDHNLKDKEKYGEASKQDQEPARATERDNPRKRRHKDTPSLPAEERIKRARKAIESLKKHSDNGTCPAAFRYRARANVQADVQFKMDVQRIRKRAEEDLINALSRFPQRQVTSLKSELQRGKRPKLANETANNKRVVQSKSSPRADTTNVNR